MKTLILCFILSFTNVLADQLPKGKLINIARVTQASVSDIEKNSDRIKYTDVVNHYYSQMYSKPLVNRKNNEGYIASSYNK